MLVEGKNLEGRDEVVIDLVCIFSPATSVQIADAAFSPAQFEIISGSTKFTIPRIAP